MRKILLINFCVLFLSFSLLAQVKIEKYLKVPFPVGNISFKANNDLVFSNHPFFSPKIRVMTYDSSKKLFKAFPNMKWNTRNQKDDMYLDDVLGIRNDSNGVVWMLDMGLKSNITPKLVAWDSKNNKLKRIYYIPKPASIKTSQLNDFVIDESRNIIIIADEDIGNGGDGSKGALVILDMNTGICKRVLEGHYSTRAEKNSIVVNNKILNVPGTNKPIRVGADGITLDKDNIWLYYAPLNGSKVYRIKMNDLLRRESSEIGKYVQKYSNKNNNGGLSIDMNNNLYLTYIETNSIGIIDSKTKTSSIYTYDIDLSWPDGVSYSEDGYMYVSAAQLPKASVFNKGKDLTSKPYYIFRFKPIVKGVRGR
ncbi:hypothetical protein E0494_04435 [Marinilabiliaceae bacterium JC040]|nr:hypothetical protein [Marinilabiliaceae bacterium JC040]